jgi:HSP20 family protein
MLTLYRPFGDLLRDEFFNNGWPFTRELAQARAGFTPAVDVVEEEGAYLVKVELPGVKPEEIEVELKEGVLTLRGERKQEHEETREGYRRIERTYGRFQRSFSLPEGVRSDAIEAHSANGVLTITVPKPAPKVEEVKRIEVKGPGIVERAKRAVAKVMDPPAATPQ